MKTKKITWVLGCHEEVQNDVKRMKNIQTLIDEINEGRATSELIWDGSRWLVRFEWSLDKDE